MSSGIDAACAANTRASAVCLSRASGNRHRLVGRFILSFESDRRSVNLNAHFCIFCESLHLLPQRGIGGPAFTNQLSPRIIHLWATNNHGSKLCLGNKAQIRIFGLSKLFVRRLKERHDISRDSLPEIEPGDDRAEQHSRGGVAMKRNAACAYEASCQNCMYEFHYHFGQRRRSECRACEAILRRHVGGSLPSLVFRQRSRKRSLRPNSRPPRPVRLCRQTKIESGSASPPGPNVGVHPEPRQRR